MRKLAIISVCGMLLLVFAGGTVAVNQQPTGSVNVALLESNDQLIRISYDIGEFSTEKVGIDGNDYYRIGLGTEPNVMDRGMPDLPFICRSIIIPDDARMEVRLAESEFIEHQMAVAPSKGFISRELNPADVSYEFSNAYGLDEFYPRDIATLGSPYILRDFRGITVTVHPFQYNPQTQTLRVYTHVVLEVRNVGPDDRNVKVRGSGRYNLHFSDIYENHFLNSKDYSYSPVGEHGRMIVISYGDFMDAAELYVDWKNQKGIPTELYDVATIASTPDLIRDFLRAEYLSEDGLTFVQFVGDYEHIPSFLISRDFCDGLATSDPSYALLEGSDSYPEIFVGRFSAADVIDVRTQVLRTIWYERDIIGGDWLHKGTGLGSIWGSGYGYLGLADRELVEMLRIMLLGYTYTEVDQLYEEDVGPYVEPVPVADFVNAINEGRGVVLVQGHGPCEADFMIPPGSLGDLFVTGDVGTLENNYMLPFIWIGAPYIGNFQIDVTFPEAWLRVRHASGDPIGAIAVYASSVDLDYASTHAAQYDMVNLLVNDQMRTVGGLMYNGACYAMDLYSDRGEKTFESYHIFGDVSLQVRTDTPEPMSVSHASVIDSGATTFEVTVTGVEDALCALSRNAELLGYAYADGSGYALIELDQPITGAIPLDLVVTAFNKTTYTAEITSNASNTVGDANGDGIIDLADAVHLLNYLFKGGPAPNPLEVGDCNCDDLVDLADVVYLLNYLFKGGPPPCVSTGVMLGYSGCKEFQKDSPPDSTPPDQDCVEYQYDGEGILLLKHVNAGFNCCPDEILGEIAVMGNTITITENESLEPSGGCDCLCLFDVDYQISDLPPGEYTITVDQLYLEEGDEMLEFTVDLISSPSGSHCVYRDHYPWGIR